MQRRSRHLPCYVAALIMVAILYVPCMQAASVKGRGGVSLPRGPSSLHNSNCIESRFRQNAPAITGRKCVRSRKIAMSAFKKSDADADFACGTMKMGARPNCPSKVDPELACGVMKMGAKPNCPENLDADFACGKMSMGKIPTTCDKDPAPSKPSCADRKLVMGTRPAECSADEDSVSV